MGVNNISAPQHNIQQDLQVIDIFCLEASQSWPSMNRVGKLELPVLPPSGRTDDPYFVPHFFKFTCQVVNYDFSPTNRRQEAIYI